MRRKQFTPREANVQQLAVEVVEHWFSGAPAWLAGLLIWMAARRASLSYAASRLTAVPSDEKARQVLLGYLPSQEALKEHFLAQVMTMMSRRVRRGRWLLAFDLHDRPYYGQDLPCLRRAQRKAGTRRFFSYATCCLVGTQQSYTLAVVPVPSQLALAEVVSQLVDQVGQLGLNIRGLLLDRGFYSAPVIDGLQRRGVPFAMPMIRRGKRGRRQEQDTGTQKFFRRGRRGHFQHTWNAHGKPGHGPQVEVRVACVPHRDRRRRPWVYVYQGLRWSLAQLQRFYRRRFAIESSYRQLQQALAKTTSRCPAYRLLLVLLALLLRNLWLWCRQALGTSLQLDDLLSALEHLLTQTFHDFVPHQRLTPNTPTTNRS
jgi:putative transposase